jgi:hypothetical protein
MQALILTLLQVSRGSASQQRISLLWYSYRSLLADAFDDMAAAALTFQLACIQDCTIQSGLGCKLQCSTWQTLCH